MEEQLLSIINNYNNIITINEINIYQYILFILIFLPLIGSLVSGLFGSFLGYKGSPLFSTTSVIISGILSIIIFCKVIHSPSGSEIIEFNIINWLDIDSIEIGWNFRCDTLTASMLIPVLIVSSLVHLYAMGYMEADPHQPRFFSYLSMFTFFMVILVTADNYLMLFVGWEFIGVASYLLISFWFTRLQAVKSALSAILLNRFGDTFLTIGLFATIWCFGTLDFKSIFSISNFVSPNVITFISICFLLGAMAKSAQLGPHIWLSLAMEGPTPVSALLHAATMVICCCLRIMKILQYLFCYMLRNNFFKFIYTVNYNFIIKYLYEIYKKILTLILLNQQVILNNITSETARKITLDNFYYFIDDNDNSNYNNYIEKKPLHKPSINPDFLDWFIGFTEGDGSFIISNNKIYFDITQTLSDIQVLYYIKKELGFGQILIRKEPNRNVGVFYVTGKENFLRLVSIFNGNLVTNYKKEQFKKWLIQYNLQYNDNINYKNTFINLSLNKAWLSGFIDAEGCFTARIKSCKLKEIPELSFSITQKDKEVLEIIKNLFIINQELNIKYKYVTFDKSWEGWRLNISSIKHLKNIILYLTKFNLKTIKHIAFLRWYKIYSLINFKDHLTKEGLEKIRKLSLNFNKNNIN
jgi:hypothetical protein